MTETEYIQNLRTALDETNRYHRYIDNFFWVLSSFLLAGSGFAISQALEMKGESYKVVILSGMMAFLWYLYRRFQKNTMDKILFYLGRINYFEKKLKIINVQPNIAQLENVKGKPFYWVMSLVTYLFWTIWGLFIIEFFVKMLSHLYYPYCWPFYLTQIKI